MTNAMYENAPSWPELEERNAMILSSSVAGILSSAVFAFMFEKLNRKICAYIISVIWFVTFILHKTANSHFWFHVTHSLWATGQMGSVFISAIYVTEIAEYDIRGSLLHLIGLLSIASHASFVICNEFVLRISLFWFVLVLPVAVIICFAFWLPETPVYFLRRENRDAATRSLLWLRRGGTTESLAQEVDELEKVLKSTRSVATNPRSVFREFFNRRTLKYSGITLVLGLNQFFGHLGPRWVLNELSLPLREDIKYLLFFLEMAAVFAGYFTAFLLCDRKGRRTLLLISQVVCSICLIPIAICTHVINITRVISAEMVFSFIFIIAYEFSFSLGFITEIVVLADIFPPKILVIQLAVIGIVKHTINIVLVNYKLLYLLRNIDSHPGVLWAHCAMCIASALLIFKYLPETMKQPAGFLFIENTNDKLHTQKKVKSPFVNYANPFTTCIHTEGNT